MADSKDGNLDLSAGGTVVEAKRGGRINYKKVQLILKVILILDVIALILVIGQAAPTSAQFLASPSRLLQMEGNPQLSIQAPEFQSSEVQAAPAVDNQSVNGERAENSVLVFSPQSSGQAEAMQSSSTAKQPPVPGQGDTCISGYIINSYHEKVGANWVVTITDSEGTSKSTKTNSEGYFEFKDLAGGIWQVEVQVPVGWRPFTAEKFTVTLSGEGSSCAEVRFKLEALSCIKVIKLDAAGMVGFEDMVGIPGWTMTAIQDNTTLNAVTDGKGYAFFFNLLSGNWTVTEEDKSGWEPADGYSKSQTIDLTPPHWPGGCEELVFVNQQIHDACVNVIKRDTVGNPVVNWMVNLTRDDGTREPLTAVTDGNGLAQFTGLALGDWTVTEEVKDWWRPVGADSKPVSLEEPGVCVDVEFTNEPLGCIDGYKINDLDEGLGGWEITATNSDTGDKIVTMSNEDGYFYFQDLSLGTWVISEEIQEGWEAVTPSEFSVDVREPFVCEHVRFKNRTPFACVDVFKKDAVDGVGLPGWMIDLKPAYGGTSQIDITDGTGWVRFDNLPAGIYTIKETVLDGWDSVTPESVTVELYASGKCTVINFENIQENMKPPEPPPAPKPHKPPKDHGTCNCNAWYTVQHGDTLSAIARRFNTTVPALVHANHLNNPNLIYAGTRLCIP